MRRLAAILLGLALALALAAPGVLADEPLEAPAAPSEESAGVEEGTAASQTEAPAPTPTVKQGTTLAPPKPSPAPKPSGGGVTAKPETKATPQAEEEPEDGAQEVPAAPPSC